MLTEHLDGTEAFSNPLKKTSYLAFVPWVCICTCPGSNRAHRTAAAQHPQTGSSHLWDFFTVPQEAREQPT